MLQMVPRITLSAIPDAVEGFRQRRDRNVTPFGDTNTNADCALQ